MLVFSLFTSRLQTDALLWPFLTIECSLLIFVYQRSYKNKLILQQGGIDCHLNVAVKAYIFPHKGVFKGFCTLLGLSQCRKVVSDILGQPVGPFFKDLDPGRWD